MAGEPPALDAIALGEAGTATVQNFAMPGIPAILMMNATKAPTDDINVRKAIIHAVNQEELAQTAFQSLGLPTYGTVSPTTWGFSEESASLYSYNIDEAAPRLEESGWVDSNGDGIREKDGANLTLDWPDNPAWSEAFNELVIGYLTNAGFEVQYRSMDDGAAYEEILAGKYTFVYMYWVRADPSPLRYLFHSDNVNGNGAYVAIDPKHLKAHNNLALASIDVGELELAEAHYRESLAIKPQPAIYNDLGVVLERMGLQEDAVAACRKALDLDPESAAAHANLGVSLARSGQYAEAEKHLRAALAADPGNAAAQQALTQAVSGAGRAPPAPPR